MARTYGYSTDFDEEVEMLFREAKFLGEGHNGIVYEVPGNKAIKIFQDTDICKQEAKILYRVKKSKYFHKIYKCGDYYILRQMVKGKSFDHYIKEIGLSSKLVRNIYNLIEEFDRLNFTKLDARCRDIYVDTHERVMVIDPKQCYSRKANYPRHLMKGINNINYLPKFIAEVRRINEKKANYWSKSINQYLNNMQEDQFSYGEN